MNFEEITLRQEVSHRGGGIEISLASFGYAGMKMTAYQNYLGGGMLGRIMTDCTISDYLDYDDLSKIAMDLGVYFHGLTNPVDDEWSQSSFEENQLRSGSAF